MFRVLFVVVVLAAAVGCARGDAGDGAAITPEPATRGVTAVEGSAELAPSAQRVSPPPGSSVAVAQPAAATAAAPSADAPATRSVPLAITGMT